MQVKHKYLISDVDRHGNERIYVRVPGHPKVRLRGEPGSPEFTAAYLAAITAPPEPKPKEQRATGPAPGSLAALCLKYFNSPEFRALDQKTQRKRRRMLDKTCEYMGWGAKEFARMEPRYIRDRRNTLQETPSMANEFVKALRSLYKFAQEYALMDRNPAADVPLLRTRSGGHHTWTEDEVARFEAAHPIGSQARLALALGLCTGQRLSDCIRLGRQHVKNGRLEFTQFKNHNRCPNRLSIPIVAELKRILDASPLGDLNFIVTKQGTQFVENSFGDKFRRWCAEAGLPKECTFHGLRKAAAVRFAEAGCTELEIMAWTGHRSSKLVGIYTRGARQSRLADSAAERLAERSANK